MLIAISANGPDPEAVMAERFGRASGFLIHDTETGEYTPFDNNQTAQLAQGAGIATAQALAERGVRAVITGSVGPKAWAALNGAGIEIVTCSDCSVREAVERFGAGGLARAVAGPEKAGVAPGGQAAGFAPGCRRTGGMGMGQGRGGGRGMGGGGRGMGGGGRGMGGRGMGGGGMGNGRAR